MLKELGAGFCGNNLRYLNEMVISHLQMAFFEGLLDQRFERWVRRVTTISALQRASNQRSGILPKSLQEKAR